MRCGYADTSSGQVHYREHGTGRPVLLLHKTPSSSVMWTRVMPLLAERGYRAIATDNPGYGASEPPPAPPEEMGFYSRAALGVLDCLGIEQADVVGYYTGASIALDLAVTAPARVGKLVLAGLAAFPDDAARAEFEALIGGLGHMQHSIELDVEGRFLEQYPLAWFRDFLKGDGEQYLDELVAYLQCARNYSWAYEAVVRHDAFGQLARVTQPGSTVLRDRGAFGRAVRAGSGRAGRAGGPSKRSERGAHRLGAGPAAKAAGPQPGRAAT